MQEKYLTRGMERQTSHKFPEAGNSQTNSPFNLTLHSLLICLNDDKFTATDFHLMLEILCADTFVSSAKMSFYLSMARDGHLLKFDMAVLRNCNFGMNSVSVCIFFNFVCIHIFLAIPIELIP